MNNAYKSLITQLKTELENDTIIDYLINNFTCITNCGVGEKYEQDFNLLTLANQKLIKKIHNKNQKVIIELYEYEKAPHGYFIAYNKYNIADIDNIECDIFI